jgi:hypothetical protein
MDDGTLCVHAEGEPSAVEELVAWVRSVPSVDVAGDRSVRVEGHEQFAIRGVSAGTFVVEERQGSPFELRLELGDVMRSWVLPKGPSMDPGVKRFAVQAEDRAVADAGAKGGTGGDGETAWDRGTYEQGGRVPWPEALDRGHAVFVLARRQAPRWLRSAANPWRRHAAVAADQTSRRLCPPGIGRRR